MPSQKQETICGISSDRSSAMKLLIFFCMLSFSFIGRSLCQSDIPPVRAVNLGAWLVTEGWLTPYLFDGIPNADLLDGTKLQFKSVKSGKYLSAINGGGAIVIANTTAASHSENFRLWRINETTFNFRVSNKQFVGLNISGNGIDVIAVANAPGVTETFEIQRNPNDVNRVRIKAPNGFFLQVKTEDLITADYQVNGGWEDDDPSVFLMNKILTMGGEYQLTNGYGPLLAPKVMKEHWSTFIVEKDFEFMKNNGINAARIPVGWWIAYDPNPPKPFVGGSLQALDNAFSWAEKNGIKIIINLHGAPGSQNGWEQSGSRDGSLEWGQTEDNIQQTVDVIDFLTARYARSPSLFAVALINEPIAPEVSLDSLIKYYKAGYDAVRKHSSTAYVVLTSRYGPGSEPKEVFSLANGLTKTAIDLHLYNLIPTTPDNVTVQQSIDMVYKNWSSRLDEITTSNGPLVFVGEWVAEWKVKNATKEDYQRFAKAQLEVFGRTTFGWAYWTLKCVYPFWSLEWMINNGFIKLI